MIAKELLIFIIVLLIAKFLWKWKRLIYLSRKIPTSNWDYSISGIIGGLTADNFTIFKMIYNCMTDKLTKTWLGPLLFINICSPEDIKLVMNAKECVNKPYFVSKFSRLALGSLFGNDDIWHSHRKILNPFFGIQSLRTIIPIFNEKSQILMDNVRRMEGKGEFDIFHYMTALTLETILKVLEFDVDIQNLKSENRDIFIKKLENYTTSVTLRMYKLWFHPEIFYQFSSIYEIEKDGYSACGMVFSRKVMENAREKYNTNNNETDRKQRSIVRALVDPKYNLTDDEIIVEIGSLVLAAQDTSAIASSTTLLMLAMNKDVQDKVVAELKQVLGTNKDDLYLDYETLNELKYLELVINEVLRLFPVVPYVFRSIDAELTSSEGYVIPADSCIIIPIFQIQRNKSFWGEDAGEFKPERFEEENLEKIHPYAYIPFAKGSRMCLGYRYAMFLMKIQLAKFLMQYEVDTTMKYKDIDFKLTVTLNIVQGYKISIKDRKF